MSSKTLALINTSGTILLQTTILDTDTTSGLRVNCYASSVGIYFTASNPNMTLGMFSISDFSHLYKIKLTGDWNNSFNPAFESPLSMETLI